MRLVFMGTPDFAVPALERLIRHGYKPVAVVTAPDRRRGRGGGVSPTPVKAVAEAHALPVLQPASVKDPAFAEAIAALRVDVMAVVAFRILPPAVFTQARLGAFNLHASLLPAFRGAAPINRALMEGMRETGVTTFFLKAKVDTGDMILQWPIPVGATETAGQLHDRLMHLGAEAVLETVRRIEAGTVASTPQDDALASPAPKIFREDARIPWHLSAAQVHNHVRGLSPYPTAWTMHGNTQLKIYRVGPVAGSGAPGTILEADNQLVVACGEGAVAVEDVKREGRSRMPAEALLKGYRMSAGEVLE